MQNEKEHENKVEKKFNIQIEQRNKRSCHFKFIEFADIKRHGSDFVYNIHTGTVV